MEARKTDDLTARIALSIALTVSVVVAGVVLFRIQTAPASQLETANEDQRILAAGTMESTAHEAGAENEASGEDEAYVDPSASDSTEGDQALVQSGHVHRRRRHRRPRTTVTSSSTTVTTTEGTTTTVSSSSTTIETSTGPLVLPATIPYPSGLAAGEGFSFEIGCGDTEEDENGNPPVDCDPNAQGAAAIARFEYFGHGMPYLYSEAVEGGHDHAWWIAGDREGYRCAYGFMLDKHPNPFGMLDEPRPSEIIARATIVRPLGQGYGMINDKNMLEAQRYYEGTPYTAGTNEIPDQNCQDVALEDFDYEGYQPHGPDQIRVGLFRADGEIGDIRDFTTIAPLLPGHFEFISLHDGRATIVFILGATNKVSHVFYYDSLGSGRIAAEVNGQLEQ